MSVYVHDLFMPNVANVHKRIAQDRENDNAKIFWMHDL